MKRDPSAPDAAIESRPPAGEKPPAARPFPLVRALAVAALALGFAAIFGNPYRGHVVTLDTRELAIIVGSEIDHVDSAELADWIIRGETDFRLIDLRDTVDYAEYHIPLAEQVEIAALPDHPLLRNEKVVLYSDGGIHAAQGWFLLKAQGYAGAYTLLGGLDAWKDEILFPLLEDAMDAQQTARAREVSRFFGGSPRDAGEQPAETARARMPVVEAPTAPVVPQRKKKSKDGC